MKDEILQHINDPAQLEKLYRSAKAPFKREFNALYPEIKGNAIADIWNERLNFESEEISWGKTEELVFIVFAALIAGFIARIPIMMELDTDHFYSRNLSFIVFPFLIAYFAWKHKLADKKIILIAAITIATIVFINVLPSDVDHSDTLLLSCMHLPLFLWSVLGFVFVGHLRNGVDKRLEFLRFNGDLVVMSGLLLISGVALTGVTIGLFHLIDMNIEDFASNYIGPFGLAAVPIVGAYLTRTNPQLVGRVSPAIGRIFSPFVLVMLVVYLCAIIGSGRDPYNDRDFLLLFNVLLIGVMAIIFFSVAEASKNEKSRIETIILFLLSAVTIIVNCIALSAIVFRISEWGITPNRLAVLGGNILILANLLIVAWQLYRSISRKQDTHSVGLAIARYLPIYTIWTIIVTFIFPLIFSFE